MFSMGSKRQPFNQGEIVVTGRQNMFWVDDSKVDLFKVVYCWRDLTGAWQVELVKPAEDYEAVASLLPAHLVQKLKDYMKQKTQEIEHAYRSTNPIGALLYGLGTGGSR